MNYFKIKVLAGLALFITLAAGIYNFTGSPSNKVSVSAAPNLIVSAVVPLPLSVIQNTNVPGIVYKIHNANGTDSYPITFDNLNTYGITSTTTCGTLAPGQDCTVTMNLAVPALPAGKTQFLYLHPVKVLGAPGSYGFMLQTTIVATSTDVTPDSVIQTVDHISYGGTFTVTLTDSSGTPHVCTSVNFGGPNPLCEALPQGTYTTHVAPASFTVSSAENVSTTYLAPPDGSLHLVHNGDTATFTYTIDSTIQVSTDITAPSLGAGTVAITATGGGHTYGPHNQGSGTVLFDNMAPGTYTVTATSYTVSGTTYVPTLSNPYTIDGAHTTIPIVYTPAPPLTQSVDTVITAPNLPTGQTVAITLSDSSNTYGPHNQSAGTVFFDNVVDASDYTVTCPNYTVGPDTYACTPPNPVTIDASHTTITLVYSKVAPPGANYDWHQSHLTPIKNANFAAIIWGGGSTTAPIKISSNPVANQWLIDQIATYESSPTLVGSNATIKRFPPYIAMGSVSEVTSGVTDQFKAQQLDVDNHYEGNGDNSAGCMWPQHNATQGGGNQTDWFYTANQNAGTQPFYWQTTPTSSNLIPAGTYMITGDQFIHTIDASHFQQYTGKIGTPVQVDANHVTIPETFIALPVNTSNSNPVLSNTNTVTFTVDTYVSTNVTFPVGIMPPFGTSNITFASNMCGSSYYSWGGYTPQVDNIAAQAAAVKAANSHTLIAGNVFYTTRFSDGETQVQDDIENPYNVTAAFFNLMWDAQRMEYQYTTNNIPMVLLLNPDTTLLFQNCGKDYCYLSWKPGITNDPKTHLLANPTLQANIFSAIDQMVTRGYLSSSAGAAMKADYISNGIATPTDGRTVPGIPEYILSINWAVKYLAPDVPFGNGNNIYDSPNPLLLPSPGSQSAPWETGAATWIHSVNHLPSSVPGTVNEHIQFEGQRLANYLKDMKFVGRSDGSYKPDFIYFDKYERDEIENFIFDGSGQNTPQATYINGGYEFNGVDWDSYLYYMASVDTNINNIPLILWQMPGSSLQTSTSFACSASAGSVNVVSLTSASGVATATMPAAHGLSTGASIYVGGAQQTEYNGTFTITVTSPTEFTYPISGSPASPATPIPGQSIAVNGIPAHVCYGSSTPTWVFGDPDLNIDMTNLSSKLAVNQVPFTPLLNNSIYFTSKSGVANAEDYLKLTTSSP